MTSSNRSLSVRWTATPLLRRTALWVPLLFATLPAFADRIPQPKPPLPLYQQECSSCHLAFPPALLPAESWRQLLQSLGNHYGADAALDAESTARLSAWLQANAAQGKRARNRPSEQRITRSVWFVKKHDEVDEAVWKRPGVRSPANCAACHTGAEQGDFNERDIKIPR